MATGGTDEYAGTGADDGDAIDGAPIIELGAIFGAGDGGRTGGDSGSGGDSTDTYQRNADGTVKRNADGSPRKRRQRKSGGLNARRSDTKGVAVSVSGIEALLFSTHAILAATTKTPELALEKEESNALAQAMADVAKFYPMAISAETIAWTNLATCMGMTYIPRAFLIAKRKAAEAEAERKKSPDQIGVLG